MEVHITKEDRETAELLSAEAEDSQSESSEGAEEGGLPEEPGLGPQEDEDTWFDAEEEHFEDAQEGSAPTTDRPGKFKKCSAVFLFRENSTGLQVLLVEWAGGVHEKWQIPSAESTEDETARETAVRAVKEQAG